MSTARARNRTDEDVVNCRYRRAVRIFLMSAGALEFPVSKRSLVTLLRKMGVCAECRIRQQRQSTRACQGEPVFLQMGDSLTIATWRPAVESVFDIHANAPYCSNTLRPTLCITGRADGP